MMIQHSSKIFFLATISLFINYTNAATYYSVSNGDWDSDIWSTTSGGSTCGCSVNEGSDDFVIQSVVTLDIHLTGGNAIGGSITVDNGSSLETSTRDIIFKAGSTLTLNGNLDSRDLTFSNGSIISVGSTGTITVHGDFENKNNSDDVTVDGQLDVKGSFDNGTGAQITGNGTILYDSNNFTNSGTISGYDNTTGTINLGSALPIELSHFGVNWKNDELLISWVTESEINNDYFEIQKVAMGSEDLGWETVLTVDGRGTSNATNEYFTVDHSFEKVSSYYRLKQVDYDGAYTYSKIVSIEIEENSAVQSTLYPNPAVLGDDIKIKFSSFNEDDNVVISVYDMSGRLILESSQSGFEDVVNVTLNEQFNTGTYLFQIQTNGSLANHKVVIK